jgi:hypothetical protein
MFMDELLYGREREREREWAGLSTESARATLTLAESLWLKSLGSGGWVGGERRSWQNLLGGNASPFTRIQGMKLK